MSGIKGSFSAAITTLENHRCLFNKKDKDDIDIAIKVLEALGRADDLEKADKLCEAANEAGWLIQNFCKHAERIRVLNQIIKAIADYEEEK